MGVLKNVKFQTIPLRLRLGLGLGLELGLRFLKNNIWRHLLNNKLQILSC